MALKVTHKLTQRDTSATTNTLSPSLASSGRHTMAENESLSTSSSKTHEYELTHVLRGHTSDVRSVAATYEPLSQREALLSGSRDELATYWSRTPGASTFDKGSTFQGHRFCNAVEFVSPANGLPRGQILMGSLDSQIRCYDPLRSDKPAQILSEHWDNISVISACAEDGSRDDLPAFISGSWDKTARVWMWDEDRWKCRYVLRGHQEAVWGAQIVEPPDSGRNQGRYLTSSADLFIRLFHGDQLHAVYAGHTDVVRSLRLLPPLAANEGSSLYAGEPLFSSASNDTTIRIWSLDPRGSDTPGNGGEAIQVLRGHTSLVYDIAAFLERGTDTPRLVSSGEDGTFRVWNWCTAELLQTIAVPVISVWSIAVLPVSQDVVVGCSDGLVRIYSTSPALLEESQVESSFAGARLSASEAEAEAQRAQEVQHSLQSVIQAKHSAVDEEHTDGEGEVFEGKKYDYVLRIDVKDDEVPLPFPINRTDDREQKAKEFVARHSLPESYVQRIVEFVSLVMG